MKTNEVWVYIEHNDGKIADVSLELLGKGSELASKLGVKTGAVIIGDKVSALSKDIFQYGADKVYMAQAPELKYFTTLPYANIVCNLIREYEPQIALYGATTQGRDVAPRIASELRVGLTADCTNLQIGDYTGKTPKAKRIIPIFSIRSVPLSAATSSRLSSAPTTVPRWRRSAKA
jgi:electron transfer flavoprotein alpha subunit